MKVVAGIDVGKGSLDVSVSAGPVRRFDNTPEGIAVLLQWLQGNRVTDAVCESTGGYEREVVRGLHGTEISVHVAHPNRVRNFARASGYEAKTDPLDARMLSRYGEVFELHSTLAEDGDSEVVRDLLRRRKQLVEQRVQERNRLDKGLTEGARTSTERHIRWLDEEIGQLEDEYHKALDNSVELSESAALYRSVPGVGDLTAATLVVYLPELGQCNGKGVDVAGGSGAVVQGQWSPAWVSLNPWWTWNSASGVVPGRTIGDTLQRRPAQLLRGSAQTGQAGQSGVGGGDAQNAAVAQRHCASRDALGGTPLACIVEKA